MTPEALARLHAQCFSEAPPPWSAASFRTLLADPYVVLVTGVSGFALARAVAGEAELLTLAVHPDARRLGHAGNFLQRLVSRLAEHSATTLFCEVAESNTAARALYAACGFTDAGRRKGYYRIASGQHIDAIILQKSLVEEPVRQAPPAKPRTQKRD